MTDYKHYGDEELSSLLQQGDHEAYTVIYDRYKFLLLAHAYKKLQDREEARDIVQEAFLLLWNKRETIDPQANLSGYLYTILRNNILNRFARQEVQSRYSTSMQQCYLADYSPTDHKVRSHQLAAAIDREIAALPEKMRMVFVMSRQQHKSRREIALELNISEKTVDRQIANALKILRTRLTLVGYLMVWLNI